MVKEIKKKKVIRKTKAEIIKKFHKDTKKPKVATVKKKKPLSDQRLLYIDKYFEFKFDRVEAYLYAYPKVLNRETASKLATRLMKVDEVFEEIERRRSEIKEEHKDVIDGIQEELKLMGFSNIGNYLSFGPDGVTLKDSSVFTPEMFACISEVSESITKEGGTVRFKLHAKEKALELLMKYHGLIVEKSEVTGKDGGPIKTTITNFPPEPKNIEEWIEMCRKMDAIIKKEKEEKSDA